MYETEHSVAVKNGAGIYASPAVIVVRAEGPGGARAVQAIVNLFERRFGED
jgi:phosphotransferase system HPr-like phosphotransfer protein